MNETPGIESVPPVTAPVHGDAMAAMPARGTPGWWSWLLAELRQDPAHALTLAYMAVSILGVWASFWFFRSFGVGILDYMSPSDYLTAGLRDPSHLIVVVAAYFLARWVSWPHRAWLRDPEGYLALRARSRMSRLLLPGDPDRFNRWLRDRVGWGGFTAVGAVMYGVLTLGLCMSMAVAVNKAEQIRAGGGHAVRVTLAGRDAPEPGSARMLGAVGDFVFLYWPATRRAEALALANAARVESLRPAPRPAARKP
ncbi:hypothetical protein DCD74_05740 [Lysobacter oculi]|uniref:Uncharacterized protein n=1 Tax=Solilutibacter oculi TaxID=2698682 RepID=A0A344J5F1_9GAMM|nr:hypothetical protein [Lysobacter oculi]AXA84261.1 hypothetical protein DCD74_05740 [Lysobacter oculi]